MEKETLRAKTKEFSIPVDVLKALQSEIRFKPRIPPGNGYIVFDLEMLKSVLRSGDVEKQKKYANNLDILEKARAGLYILETEQTRG